MIKAKYPNACALCGKPIQIGVDLYDMDEKKSYHAECLANPKPGPEAYRIAADCKFEDHAVLMERLPKVDS